ncbi:MAG: c-type cytochrome [Bermanella sp.]
MKYFWQVVLWSCVFSASVHGDEYDGLLNEMAQIKANPIRLQESIESGQERSMLCGYCHGKDGNSVKNYIPNLAQQNTEYLLKQFLLFSNGERKSYVMQQLSKTLSGQEKIDLALYYSSQQVTKISDVVGSVKGHDKYQSFCFACHGENGEGNKDLPRLAGQKKEFLLKTLSAFKQGKKSRSTSPMVKIMRTVKASDIEPLADYISNMGATAL